MMIFFSLTDHSASWMILKVSVFLFIQIAEGFSLAAPPDSVIQLGGRREIFVDDFLIERTDGVNLTMHRPVKEEAVLEFDKPWEGKFSGFVTIIKDDSIFRAYYRGSPIATDEYQRGSFVCYAESVDGIHWKKPDLKISEQYWHISNNIILEKENALGNFSPFLDRNPRARRDQRFKAIAGTEKSGLIAYASADGIHWKKITKDPIITKQKGDPQLFDSQNVAFWSESEQKYVCYFRTRVDNGKGDDRIRSVARTTSDDFINWESPVNMAFDRGGHEHIYIQQTSPYYRAPHIYIATAARFMKNRQIVSVSEGERLNVDMGQIKDCSDAVLISSRGQNRYTRTFMESFVRPEIGLNNWTGRTNYPALNIVETGTNEMSMYMTKDYAQPTIHLARYSMRIDGFSSVHGPYPGGEFLTKPFSFTGDKLEINYATSAAGQIRIEIQDPDGIPVRGYTLEECETIIGNQISRKVKWKGGSDVGPLTGKTVRLRIYIQDGDLFSLRFQ